jgi:hypothetical protein
MDEKSFNSGFQFALLVVQATTGDVFNSFEKIVDTLASVAEGEVTLQPSPQEAINAIESLAGESITEEGRDFVHQILSGESRQKATNLYRMYADMVLTSMSGGESKLF